MKILIAGSDINAKLLASYLKIEDSANDIYVATEEESLENVYTAINIKENDIVSICDFVKYNQIEFTVALSPMAIINGIADEFKKEGFPVFAPSSAAARVTFFNSIAKKIMYKLKINTPKFGIFDRENMAVEYIRKMKFPIVITRDFTLFNGGSSVYENFSKAKLEIQKIFEEGNNKIVIENYIPEESYYMYFITDGYNALPLCSVFREQYEKYTLTQSPANKVSESIVRSLLQRVIYPLLDDINNYADMYAGIIGLKFKIHNNMILVNEFYNNFQEYDFQTIMPRINDNLRDILYDAANSSLSDNHDFINIEDNYSYTIAIDKSEADKAIEEDDDFIVSENTSRYIFTRTASTLNRAKDDMHDYLRTILSENTVNSIIENNLQKELRV